MCESDSLVQFYPVAESRIFLTWEPAGWVLEERHRHETGDWALCRTTHCERLSAAELLDVIDAILSTHRHPGPP